MRSRSARKVGLVGARGARWVVANWRAVEISGEFAFPFGLDVQARISSMSCKRRSEKCRVLSVSRSCGVLVLAEIIDCHQVTEREIEDQYCNHTED